MAKQKKMVQGEDPEPLSKTIKISFPNDTYYEGLPPYGPGEHEISMEIFKLIEGKGTYKIIE